MNLSYKISISLVFFIMAVTRFVQTMGWGDADHLRLIFLIVSLVFCVVAIGVTIVVGFLLKGKYGELIRNKFPFLEKHFSNDKIAIMHSVCADMIRGHAGIKLRNPSTFKFKEYTKEQIDQKNITFTADVYKIELEFSNRYALIRNHKPDVNINELFQKRNYIIEDKRKMVRSATKDHMKYILSEFMLRKERIERRYELLFTYDIQSFQVSIDPWYKRYRYMYHLVLNYYLSVAVLYDYMLHMCKFCDFWCRFSHMDGDGVIFKFKAINRHYEKLLMYGDVLTGRAHTNLAALQAYEEQLKHIISGQDAKPPEPEQSVTIH